MINNGDKFSCLPRISLFKNFVVSKSCFTRTAFSIWQFNVSVDTNSGKVDGDRVCIKAHMLLIVAKLESSLILLASPILFKNSKSLR